MTFRKKVDDYTRKNMDDFTEISKLIDEANKKVNVNLIVLNIGESSQINHDL